MSTTKLFASLSALRSSIQKDIETYELPIEKNDVNKAFFEPNNDTFEAVCIQEGNPQKILIPAANMYPFLFRGQTKDFGKCLPSLYREEDKQTAPYLFLERLREVEFTELIKKHPVVKGFFDRHHFTVDFIGLAQHYGLKTDVLDLTNDLDVALFLPCAHTTVSMTNTLIITMANSIQLYSTLCLRLSTPPVYPTLFSKAKSLQSDSSLSNVPVHNEALLYICLTVSSYEPTNTSFNSLAKIRKNILTNLNKEKHYG